MLESVVIAVTFVLLFLIAVNYLYPRSTKITNVPGLDPTDKKDGNFADIKNAGSLHEFLVDLHRKFGEIASFWMGSQFTVSIASPQLFAENSRVFDRPPSLFEQFSPLITSESIQFANGVDGRGRRSLYDRCYSHVEVCNYYSVLQQVVDELVVKLSSVSADDHVPLRQNMFALAIKAIAKVSFGDYFDDDEKVLQLEKYYATCWSEMERRLIHGDFDPDVNSAGQKRFNADLQCYHSMIKDVIRTRREKETPGDHALFIDVLLESGASEERILADCITFMVGGFHTTGLLMTWCIDFLASHPDVQEKLYRELWDTFGGENATPDSIKQLTYTRQVIDETLRCSVLGPFAARFQDTDVQLGGYFLPKNTPVIHALGVVLQNETLWPQPEKFDPERFRDENKNSRPNFSFEPFGFAGKRKCPGYRLTYAEATVWLTALIQKFEFKLVEGQVIKKEFGLVTSPDVEIWVTIHPRR